VLGTSPATIVRVRGWQDGVREPRNWHDAAEVIERVLDYAGTSGYRFQAPDQQVAWPVRTRHSRVMNLQFTAR
jgi:hypothetical protein